MRRVRRCEFCDDRSDFVLASSDLHLCYWHGVLYLLGRWYMRAKG